MATNEQELPDPPKAPKTERKLRFHRTQVIGVPLLALIPILALFFAFGTTHERNSMEVGSMEVDVLFPGRFRHKTVAPLQVSVRNHGDAPLQEAFVSIDKEYLDAFETTGFSPAPIMVTEGAYVFALGEIPAGEARALDGTLQAQRHWRHSGRITVRGDSGDVAELRVVTFAFP